MHVGLPAAYDGALLELAEVIARSIAEQPDEKRSIARQPTRVEIGSIIELLDGLEDALARIGTHQRLIVDDSRYGLGRDLRKIGDLLDGHRRGDGCHGERSNLVASTAAILSGLPPADTACARPERRTAPEPLKSSPRTRRTPRRQTVHPPWRDP